MLTGRRAVEPWKMTSSIFPPRSSLADCSPSTQRTASETLLFPQPFGPTMAVTPSSKVSVTVSANDLKPDSSSLVSFMRDPYESAGPGAPSTGGVGGDDERWHADLAAGLLGFLAGGEGAEDDAVQLFAA